MHKANNPTILHNYRIVIKHKFCRDFKRHFMVVMSQIPLFNMVEDSFLRDLCSKINLVLFLPGDCIVQKGDMGSELYYIHQGEVSY